MVLERSDRIGAIVYSQWILSLHCVSFQDDTFYRLLPTVCCGEAAYIPYVSCFSLPKNSNCVFVELSSV